MELIMKAINDLRQNKVSDIDMLALVTESSYEVVFYGSINGERVQSNEMVEKDMLNAGVVDSFYSNVADAIRRSPEYQSDKMNIVTVNRADKVEIKYDDKNCSVHKIKKEWKTTL